MRSVQQPVTFPHIATVMSCKSHTEDAYKVSKTLIAAQAYQAGILFISLLCVDAPHESV